MRSSVPGPHRRSEFRDTWNELPMQRRNTPEHYASILVGIHWITVALVLIGWTLGTFGDDFPRGPARATALFVHISAGLAILPLLVARLVWRVGDPPPPPELTVFGIWGEYAARLGHFLLYALLVAVPLLGIVVQFARGNPLPVFGVLDIPSPWAANRAFARSMREVHELLAHSLVIVAALHAAAALIHHWVLGDRTLQRMLPWRSS